MAYRSLERESNYAYGSSSSCLDGVPFKISPQFQIPNKVKLQADFLKSPKHAREEYNFEIEEGVMKWALERERQLHAQRLEEEVRAGKIRRGPITITQEETDSESEDEWLKNGTQTSNVNKQNATEVPSVVRKPPKPLPRPPKPRQPIISNDILTPIQITSANNNHDKDESGSNKPVDVTLFEKVDDPFDMFERQTLNDLEELKNVFQCTNQSTNCTTTQPIDNIQQRNTDTQVVDNACHNLQSNNAQQMDTANQCQGNGAEACYSNGANVNNAFTGNSGLRSDMGDYITLKEEPEVPNTTSSPQIDLRELPPVPPRTYLVNKDPLPPINCQTEECAIASQHSQESSTNFTNYENTNTVLSNPFLTDNFSNAQPPVYENINKPFFKPVDTDIPNYENIDIQNGRVVYKRTSESSLSHESLLKSASKTRHSNYVNVAPALPLNDNVIRNAKSTPDIVNTVNGVATSSDVFDRAPFPMSRSPPYRPSSQQDLLKQNIYVDLPSWNKYSPLPSPSGGAVSKSSSTSDFASPSEVDPYVKLSSECQGIVNNLVSMGFSRPRVARAVENFGCDEKVIVEHLFQVDKMSEAGFDTYQSELALVIYKNKKDKAEVYLRMFKQFQELGFSGDRIKEALVKFDNDSDKALDYLTT